MRAAATTSTKSPPPGRQRGGHSHTELGCPDIHLPGGIELPMLHRNAVLLVRLIAQESHNAYLRTKWRLQRLLSPERGSVALALNCPACEARGDRFCYSQISDCTLHMTELQKRFPWFGQAEIALVVDTWNAAQRNPCRSCGMSRTEPISDLPRLHPN
jgi:hypothetical protein